MSTHRIRDIAHLSPAERVARGKEARKRVPRSAHARFEPATDRRDPVALLAELDATRMADLVPIRWGRMLASPFAFYRGAALLMASDLSGAPESGLYGQVCGDAHVSNFGIFESPERRQVFDINDFDETLPGPWELDVKRLAASAEVLMRERGIEAPQRSAAIAGGVEAYRSAMASLAEMGHMERWYQRVEVDFLLETSAKFAEKSVTKAVRKSAEKGRQKGSLRALARLTETVDGQPRFRSEPPLLTPAEELLTPEQMERFPAVISDFLAKYRASLPDDRRRLLAGYRFVQIARKVVGVGSVGSRSWVVLMLGRDEQDPLFLQMKEAYPSVLERYWPKSRYRHRGRRVVEGQRLMQAAGDIMLGWYGLDGFDGLHHDFYVRQLWDGKASIDLASAPLELLPRYLRVCNATLARAHARTFDRIALAAYLGRGDSFDRAIASFAKAYADTNERDHQAALAAEKAGRIKVLRGI